jgi:hypothetical protein
MRVRAKGIWKSAVLRAAKKKFFEKTKKVLNKTFAPGIYNVSGA